MSTYTSFQMSLNPLPAIDQYDGTPIFIVRVQGVGIDPVNCTGRSVREAFMRATTYIEDMVSVLCEDCANVADENSETFRNAGICQGCYEDMMARQ